MWQVGPSLVQLGCPSNLVAMTRPQVGRAWCSPHDCAPLDCIDQHRNPSGIPQSFLAEMVPPVDRWPQSCEHHPRFHRYDLTVGGVKVGEVRYCDACNPGTTPS